MRLSLSNVRLLALACALQAAAYFTPPDTNGSIDATPISYLTLAVTEDQGSPDGASRDDYYKSVAEIKEKKNNTEYRITRRGGRGRAVVVGIHGGTIELGTSELVSEIASNDVPYYLFESLVMLTPGRAKNRDPNNLHVTSANFQDPPATDFVQTKDVVISMHGCKNYTFDDIPPRDGFPGRRWAERGRGMYSFIGGRDRQQANLTRDVLRDFGFYAETRFQYFPATYLRGIGRSNIVNQGRNGMGGVQFEMEHGIRMHLRNNRSRRREFATAIRRSVGLPDLR
ncbi:hypothetical protein HIM_05808 [Hirsutella minnesotensis 3608]|uniref:Uncharacterized protein n=1 Tax=Hirsutella minnesotensis 3608 TaxID=1043627 RepID=A0A0F7ZJU6_9HYPO|nr:hypothetical protein HIM_05808 [Hirsutella minnesotensis 3608]